MPRSVPFIIGNEAAERFSYYGMTSILTLYMVNQLTMSEAEATKVVHLFKSAVYFLPLLGAWIADKFLGRYWTILSISLCYCLGHGVLAAFEGNVSWLYTGLALIAFGSGGIKPCVAAFVGDQFGPKQQSLLPKIYGLFYWSVNFGSFFAFLLIPLIRDRAGYGWAFGVPGLAMGLATLIFWSGTPRYVRQPPRRETKQAGFLPVVWYALRHFRDRGRGHGLLEVARKRFSATEVAGARAVAGILMVFATVPVFWALFDQSTTTWVIQGSRMESLWIGNYELDAERMQSMNPLLVMTLIPLFTTFLYPWAERLGLRPTALRRMATGMVLAAASFFVCTWIQTQLDQDRSLSIAWQILAYVLLTSGEVMLSATGLEFAFSQAPASLKSTIMSFWNLTVALGNFLVAAVTGLNERWVGAEGAAQFLFYAVLMLLVAGIFSLCALRYREQPVADDTGSRPDR